MRQCLNDAGMDPMCSNVPLSCNCAIGCDFELSGRMLEMPEPNSGVYSTPDLAKTSS